MAGSGDARSARAGDTTSPAARHCASSPRSASTSWWSAAASPAPGVALDAASRGLRTALVERHDFASGTSSKSSKMVHGGLRYLQQREFRLVYENAGRAPAPARERPPPGLPAALPDPAVRAGRAWSPRRWPAPTRTALWLYDLTGGLRIGKRHRRIDQGGGPRPTCPPCDTDRLVAGFLYFDARADDARLTLTLAAHRRPATTGPWSPTTPRSSGSSTTARGRHGRRVRPACPFPRPEPRPSSRSGPTVVVNATGVWADDVRALDEGTHPHSIRPAKGVHVTVPGRAGCPATSPPWSRCRRDRRSIFVVPVARRRPTCTWAPPTPTTTARSTTPPAPPRTSTTCSTRPTVVTDAADPGRRHRRVGRPAPAAGARRRAPRRASAPPTCPAATRCGLSERAGHGDGRQADHLPARWPRTPSTPSSATSAPAPSEPVPHPAPAAARRCRARGAAHRRGGGRPRMDEPALRHLVARYGTETPRRARPGRRRARAARAARRRPPLAAGRGVLRRAPGDGGDPRRRPGPTHPGPSCAGPAGGRAAASAGRLMADEFGRPDAWWARRPRRWRLTGAGPRAGRPATVDTSGQALWRRRADRAGDLVPPRSPRVERRPAVGRRAARAVPPGPRRRRRHRVVWPRPVRDVQVRRSDDGPRPGRDWWPLAIGWAARGDVPATPAVVARRRHRAGGRRAALLLRGAGAGHGGGRAQRGVRRPACPSSAGWRSTCCGMAGHHRRRPRVAPGRRRCPAPSGPT